MNKLPNMKLIPTTNPNYEMKESVDELIKLLKKDTTYIVNEVTEQIMGITDITSEFYEKDGFIYGTILYRPNLFNLEKYKWINAVVSNNRNMEIKRICEIIYRGEIYEQ